MAADSWKTRRPKRLDQSGFVYIEELADFRTKAGYKKSFAAASAPTTPMPRTRRTRTAFPAPAKARRGPAAATKQEKGPKRAQ